MARQIVILALIFFAIVGMASATAPAPSPKSDADMQLAPNNNVIGIVGGSGGNYGAAPVGAPVPPGTFSPVSPAEEPNDSGSTILKASTVAGLVVSAFVGSLFF